MAEDKRTNIINDLSAKPCAAMPVISTDLSALYAILKSNTDNKLRLDTAAHLLRLVEDDQDIDEGTLAELYRDEQDVEVAAALKRVLNKIQLRRIFCDDPTAKHDRKLTSSEERKILDEIDKLRKLYDDANDDKGAFDRKYSVSGQIAQGGMGRICRAFRKEDMQPVAIKFLLLDELSRNNHRERIIARFKREGEILQKLHHPNIVKALEYKEANGEYMIVMEMAQGEPLEDIINDKALDLEAFTAISLQLCDALEYIHKNGIIHRDIKPANILITGSAPGKDCSIKLLDFGLAKDMRTSRLSRISFQAGTAEYSSPQQLKDARDVDERDDVFSLGKTMYQMLTKRTFKDSEEYIDISSFHPGTPDEIDAIIRKCISSDKKDRYPSVSALRDDLKRINK